MGFARVALLSMIVCRKWRLCCFCSSHYMVHFVIAGRICCEMVLCPEHAIYRRFFCRVAAPVAEAAAGATQSSSVALDTTGRFDVADFQHRHRLRRDYGTRCPRLCFVASMSLSAPTTRHFGIITTCLPTQFQYPK